MVVLLLLQEIKICYIVVENNLQACFGKDNMIYYNSFDELPRQKGYGIVKNNFVFISFKNIDWSTVAFK